MIINEDNISLLLLVVLGFAFFLSLTGFHDHEHYIVFIGLGWIALCKLIIPIYRSVEKRVKKI